MLIVVKDGACGDGYLGWVGWVVFVESQVIVFIQLIVVFIIDVFGVSVVCYYIGVVVIQFYGHGWCVVYVGGFEFGVHFGLVIYVFVVVDVELTVVVVFLVFDYFCCVEYVVVLVFGFDMKCVVFGLTVFVVVVQFSCARIVVIIVVIGVCLDVGAHFIVFECVWFIIGFFVVGFIEVIDVVVGVGIF